MNAKDLVSYFAAEWEKKYGSPYPIAWTKDVAIFARLLKLYGPKDVCTFVRVYLTTFDNRLAEQRGHNTHTFAGFLPEIISTMKSQQKRKKVQENPDYDRLDKARKKLNAEAQRHKD